MSDEFEPSNTARRRYWANRPGTTLYQRVRGSVVATDLLLGCVLFEFGLSIKNNNVQYAGLALMFVPFALGMMWLNWTAKDRLEDEQRRADIQARLAKDRQSLGYQTQYVVGLIILRVLMAVAVWYLAKHFPASVDVGTACLAFAAAVISVSALTIACGPS